MCKLLTQPRLPLLRSPSYCRTDYFLLHLGSLSFCVLRIWGAFTAFPLCCAPCGLCAEPATGFSTCAAPTFVSRALSRSLYFSLAFATLLSRAVRDIGKHDWRSVHTLLTPAAPFCLLVRCMSFEVSLLQCLLRTLSFCFLLFRMIPVLRLRYSCSSFWSSSPCSAFACPKLGLIRERLCVGGPHGPSVPLVTHPGFLVWVPFRLRFHCCCSTIRHEFEVLSSFSRQERPFRISFFLTFVLFLKNPGFFSQFN